MKKDCLSGMKAAVPLILGFVPVGMAYAIMARQAGFSVSETCAMSLAVFAGASQMMAVGMSMQGASVMVMILATFILNLRHLIMSACVFNRMRNGGPRIKLLAAFGVTDESFAVFTTGKEEHCSIGFFLGLFIVTYVSWNAGTLIGAVASDFLPAIVTASLGIAFYAMFIAIITPNLTGNWKLGLLVLLTALCNAMLSQVLPASWALIASTLVCAFAGIFFVDLNEDAGNE